MASSHYSNRGNGARPLDRKQLRWVISVGNSTFLTENLLDVIEMIAVYFDNVHVSHHT